MTHKRTRPFTVEYYGSGRVFPPDATDDDVAEWKKSVREWFNVPVAGSVELGAMSNAAERRAWKRDHPREPYPEYLCALSDQQYAAYNRWLDRYHQSPTYRRLMRERWRAGRAQ
jgi:hypothetical protein